MSEAVRQLWDLIEPGWDMVWVARSAINGVEFAELQAACVHLLRRAQILKTGGEPSEASASWGEET